MGDDADPTARLHDGPDRGALGKFIEQNAGGPFFIDIAFNAPHWPYQVPDKPSVAPGNGRHVMPSDAGTSTRADYVAMLERVDRGVGEILRTLDQRGLAANTIVIFTNDNGGEWLASNAPLQHRKGTLWEGGIRVPLLVRWPGRIRPGSVSPRSASRWNLTASILAATSTTVPAEAGHEGLNLFPVLEGRAPEVPARCSGEAIPAATRRRSGAATGSW